MRTTPPNRSLPPSSALSLLPPSSSSMDGASACTLLPLRLLPAAIFVISFIFLLRLPQTSASCTNPDFCTYQFPDFFTVVNGTDLVIFKDAGYSQGALQITPDGHTTSSLMNKSGRVLLNQRFKLWEDLTPSAPNVTARHIASFNTSFTINIYRPNGTIPGEGLAFLIAPDLAPPPPGSEGRYLGLTNASLDGDPSNHLVAVELDTVKGPNDPDNNHVGLDINGVVSNATANLTAIGIEIAPEEGTNYTVWVDYDGAAREIRVRIAVAGNPKPVDPVLSGPLDLSDFLLQYSYFGFAASTGTYYELNCVLAWNLTVERLPDDGGAGGIRGWKLGVLIGVPLAAVAALVGLVIGFYYRRRKVGDDPSMAMAGTLKSLPGTPREFEFRELRKATNNFDDKMKLGQGGFGVVYRGLLQGEQREVAVKKFSRGSSGLDDFLKELTIINRLRHRNLVPLVGWCHKEGTLLLVYDYMPNGSLDQHLYGGADRAPLGWEQRYNIIAGVASALHYLHDEYDQRVLHRDLKSSNVMLDAAFNARLGDFGLARALDTDKTSYAEIELGGVPGTLGYIAPECFHTGKATRTSDVFGFGAVILEVVCGRRPRNDLPGAQFLVDWVWKLHGEGRILDAVDPRLAGEFDPQDAERLLLLGLACSHPISGERPKMDAIVQIISRSVPPPTVPVNKPKFMWPAVSVDNDEDDDLGASSSGVTRRTSMTMSMPSSNYASSSGYTSRYLSKDGHTADHPLSEV